MTSLLRASIGLSGALVVGCSAPVVDDVADASGAMTEGVVLVQRTVAGDGATQSNVSAKFLRLSSPVDPDLAERLVGVKLDLPPPGACRATSATAEGQARGRSALGTIELVDVGDVTLRASEAKIPLAVRAFPDVGDLVSGMFYTSRDAATDLPAGASYTIEGTGSGQVERFSIDTEAPRALEDVRLGSVSLLEGSEPQILDDGAPLSIRWLGATSANAGDPPALRDGALQVPGDLVVVEVSGQNGASVRCSFRDEGQGVLPGWVLKSSTLGPLPATATISVHRVRGRAFSAPGIDTGEVRFDLSVSGRVLVGPRSALRP
jgi:hypothetical protein